MARIAGVELSDNKKVKIAITYIFGIGDTLAKEILEKTKIDGEAKLKDLSDDDIEKLRRTIEDNYQVEGELRQVVFRNIKRLKEIRCYRGIMHKRGLPVRGQRTRHNAHTRKGKSQAVGGLKRVLTKT
ncbi:MAG TPA: 30S ribosomal protein S13 [Candidatus Dojkabacteria bacterium]|nr:30S ribosomal protein S13 [Candidatus Dojkabacteria bacterium]HQG57853.1 30S ribosomal protein S13 [Candidatus Dojkabacteria bacterium]